MQKFIAVFLAALFLTSCGQLNTDGSSTGGDGSGNVGVGRGVIKSGGTTVAHVVNFVAGGVVAVYIPSVDKYATIELKSGNYFNLAYPYGAEFYFPSDACAGNPEVIQYHFVGEVGKTVIYKSNDTSYWLVSTKRTTAYNYKSISLADGTCGTDIDGTITPSDSGGVLYFNITPTTRPYDFEAIAPLTITYE